MHLVVSTIVKYYPFITMQSCTHQKVCMQQQSTVNSVTVIFHVTGSSESYIAPLKMGCMVALLIGESNAIIIIQVFESKLGILMSIL